MTYFAFFGLGFVLYAATPTACTRRAEGAVRRRALRGAVDVRRRFRDRAVAYLADIFGTRFVGAIHGTKLLTAWSDGRRGRAGGRRLHQGRANPGRRRAGVQVYDRTLYILSSFLVVGFHLQCPELKNPSRRSG